MNNVIAWGILFLGTLKLVSCSSIFSETDIKMITPLEQDFLHCAFTADDAVHCYSHCYGNKFLLFHYEAGTYKKMALQVFLKHEKDHTFSDFLDNPIRNGLVTNDHIHTSFLAFRHKTLSSAIKSSKNVIRLSFTVSFRIQPRLRSKVLWEIVDQLLGDENIPISYLKIDTPSHERVDSIIASVESPSAESRNEIYNRACEVSAQFDEYLIDPLLPFQYIRKNCKVATASGAGEHSFGTFLCQSVDRFASKAPVSMADFYQEWQSFGQPSNRYWEFGVPTNQLYISQNILKLHLEHLRLKSVSPLVLRFLECVYNSNTCESCLPTSTKQSFDHVSYEDMKHRVSEAVRTKYLKEDLSNAIQFRLHEPVNLPTSAVYATFADSYEPRDRSVKLWKIVFTLLSNPKFSVSKLLVQLPNIERESTLTIFVTSQSENEIAFLIQNIGLLFTHKMIHLKSLQPFLQSSVGESRLLISSAERGEIGISNEFCSTVDSAVSELRFPNDLSKELHKLAGITK